MKVTSNHQIFAFLPEIYGNFLIGEKMTFTEQLNEDLKIFVNVEEFGEMVKLDGQEIPAVVNYGTDEVTKSEPSSFQRLKPTMHGVNLLNYNLTIFFKSEDYEGRIPRQSEFIEFNGRKLRVTNSLELNGLVKLTCGADAMNTPKKPAAFEV